MLALAGLAPAQAAGLLPGRLAEGVAARLVERTRGNPLALSEVAGRLTPAQRVGAAPLPDPLPVGARLELVYEPLLAGLSAPAWRAVLLCAAGPEGTAAALVGALRQEGVDAGAALDEAEERGILVRDHGSVAFWHPLLRAAAWRLATPAQRRAAHRALGRRPAWGGRPDGQDLAPGRGGRRPRRRPGRRAGRRGRGGPDPPGVRGRLGRRGARRPAHYRPRPGGRASGRRRR